MIEILLYTRPECRLCDTMKAVVERETRGYPVSMTAVDVDSADELAREFGADVPVLFVGGKKFAKHRLEPGRLREKLRRERDTAARGASAGR